MANKQILKQDEMLALQQLSEAEEVFPEKPGVEYAFFLKNGVILPKEGVLVDEEGLNTFIDFLRKQFSDSDDIPSVVHYKGYEIQLDNKSLVTYLAYSQSGHKSIGEIVTNVLRNQRIKELYALNDSEAEKIDFEDDSPEMFSFEQMQKEADAELIQRIAVTRSSLSQKQSGDKPTTASSPKDAGVSKDTDQVGENS